MNLSEQNLSTLNSSSSDKEFEGIYGKYKITFEDRIEVQRYRFALLLCGVSFSAGILHWQTLGPTWAGLWLLPMSIGLGLALNWIHIYLRPLHRALQLLWALGCFGSLLLAIRFGAENVLTVISNQPSYIWAIGPLFAALTGIGFKEFFCFRRPEAIGLTFLVPSALIGHLTGLLGTSAVINMLSLAALLLMVLALRKFGMDAADDVGDKSVFDYLKTEKVAGHL